MTDSFSTRDVLEVNGKRYHYSSLVKLGQRFDLKRLPYSMKILLENLLRHEDGLNVTAKEIEAVANWDAKKEPDTEISFMRTCESPRSTVHVAMRLAAGSGLVLQSNIPPRIDAG